LYCPAGCSSPVTSGPPDGNSNGPDAVAVEVGESAVDVGVTVAVAEGTVIVAVAVGIAGVAALLHPVMRQIDQSVNTINICFIKHNP
jgi:hypothetical protein